jgi:hypothetical protein
MMNLYLLTQDENTGYDTYDSMVVAAESESAAAIIHPSSYISYGDGEWRWSDDSGSWATKPENVTCKLIGKAEPGIKGVVLTSFNAG